MFYTISLELINICNDRPSDFSIALVSVRLLMFCVCDRSLVRLYFLCHSPDVKDQLFLTGQIFRAVIW